MLYSLTMILNKQVSILIMKLLFLLTIRLKICSSPFFSLRKKADIILQYSARIKIGHAVHFPADEQLSCLFSEKLCFRLRSGTALEG